MKSFFKWTIKILIWMVGLTGLIYLVMFSLFPRPTTPIEIITGRPFYTKTESAIQNRATEILLTPHIHSTLSKQEIQSIVDLGSEAIPPVVDQLFGRGNFKNHQEPYVSLEILGLMKDASTLPALKEFLLNTDDSFRYLALRTMLEIKNDDEMRAYVVDVVNERIAANRKYDRLSYEFVNYIVASNDFQSIEGRVFTPLPDKDIIDICTRVHLDQYQNVSEVYRAMADDAGKAAIDVLKFYLNKDDQQWQLVQNAVSEAINYNQGQLGLLEKQLIPPKTDDDGHAGLEKVYLNLTPEQWAPYREALMTQYKQKIETLQRF